MPDDITTEDQVVEETSVGADAVEISEEIIKRHPLYKQVLAESIARRQTIKALEEAAQSKPDTKPVAVGADEIIEQAIARFRAEIASKDRPKQLLETYKLPSEYLPALVNAGEAAEAVAKALANTKRLENVQTGGDSKADPTSDIASRLRAKYNLPQK